MENKNTKSTAILCLIFGLLCNFVCVIVSVIIYKQPPLYCGLTNYPNFGVYAPDFVYVFWLPFIDFWLLCMQIVSLIATKIDIEKYNMIRISIFAGRYREHKDLPTAISQILCFPIAFILLLRLITLSQCPV